MSKEHVHQFVLDTELVETNDGPPQPRRSTFIECPYCGLILRDGDIVRAIERMVELETFIKSVFPDWIYETEEK